VPGEQLTTDLSRIDTFSAEFRGAANPDDQAAAFYGLDGLARELAAGADTARTDADDALGMAETAENERDEARRQAGEAAPHDESEELRELREKVAALAGDLATSKAETADERKARRRLEEQLANETAARERETRAHTRRLAKAQGALAVTKTHVCRPEEVPHMAPAGVVQGLRIWAQNSVPGQQWVIVLTHQDPSGETVTITAKRNPRMGDEEYAEGAFVETQVVIDDPATERSTLELKQVTTAPEEAAESQ
jgi:hypothetical protein